MKQNLCVKLTLCVLLALAVPAVFAQMPQPFSADMTSTHSNGQTMTGKWYFAPPNMRIDMSMPPGTGGPYGGSMGMIVDGVSKTTYMLMPQRHMYMEFHGERQNSMSPALHNMLHMKGGTDPCSADTDSTCKKLGTETVNGRNCDKWEVVSKNSRKSTMWIDQKIHFPIKAQNADGTVTEFSNIKEGAQDAALFKVPSGYKPFDPAARGGQRRPK